MIIDICQFFNPVPYHDPKQKVWAVVKTETAKLPTLTAEARAERAMNLRR
jgi:hypothetical protein